jgi:hypothetical protein
MMNENLNMTECLDRIRNLPNAGLIGHEDAIIWIERVKAIDPQKLGWHIQRAGGIGGSEIGTLISWAFGDFKSRGNAGRLAKQKLLMLPPDRPNDDMARGLFLEPHIRAVFETRLTADGHDWKRRDDLEVLAQDSVHPAYPWLRGSMDGIYEIDNKIILVDFKSPSEESLDNCLRYKNYDDYRAQLNHYALVCEGADIIIDDMALVLYDYRRAGTIGVHVEPIALDPGLQQKIVEAGNDFWNEFVMKGLVPDTATRQLVRPVGGVPEDLELMARKAILYKVTGEHVIKQYEEIRHDIANRVNGIGQLGQGSLMIGSFDDEENGMLVVTAKKTLVPELAIERLTDLGYDEKAIEDLRGPEEYKDPKNAFKKLDAFYALGQQIAQECRENPNELRISRETFNLLMASIRRPLSKKPGEWDEEKIKEALVLCNEDVYSFMTEACSPVLDRRNRPDLDNLKREMAEEADVLVNAVLNSKTELDYDSDVALT